MRQQTSSFIQLLCKCLKFRKTKSQNYEQIKNPIEIPQQNERSKGRKTLVIDLDETLVHSSFEPMKVNDLIVEVTMKDQKYKIYVNIRPYAQEFIKETSKIFEIIIFTASISEYANSVIDFLDPLGLVDLRLFRENCTIYNGVLVKDLSLLKRNLDSVILIDNSVNSFMLQPMNAVHILNYFEDKTDQELALLIPFLKLLSQFQDVRPVHEWLFKYAHFDKFEYVDVMGTKQQFYDLPTSSDTQRDKLLSPADTPKLEEHKILIKSGIKIQTQEKNKEDEINDELEEKKNNSMSVDKFTETPNRSESNNEKISVLRENLNINSPNSLGKQILFPQHQ
ncbi:unnamed protein product [Paramecium pentaurelia]|uniref:FCP1 homology domain-containing protein n=1 Tax=Paramecium pentaurelia TaxID=43138 RepID=A0A8S1RZC3_9CILI|nr:unnamed protein product [Paramecium pentaurelia]